MVNEDTILEDHLFLFKNKTPPGGKRNLYQHPLRRISIKREGKKPIILVTNLLDVPAKIIGELYKERWEIELFFKWIKQNLRIKKFLGISENAVKIQIAVVLILYPLMALFNRNEPTQKSMHQLLIWLRHNCSLICAHYKLLKPPEYLLLKRSGTHRFSRRHL